jgi:hypothetical protein
MQLHYNDSNGKQQTAEIKDGRLYINNTAYFYDNISKSDATVYPTPWDGFTVNADGNVRLRRPDGSDVTVYVKAGVPQGYAFTKFYDTNTDSNITLITAYRYTE